MGDEKTSKRLEETKERMLDKLFSLVDFSAEQVSRSARDAMGTGILRLTVESLQTLLDAVSTQVTKMGRGKFSSNTLFVEFVKDELTQYWNLLDQISTPDRVLDNYRQTVQQKFDEIISDVFSTLKSKPPSKLFGKRITEAERHDHVSKLLEEKIPKWREGLILFCQQKLSSLEVVRRMKAESEKDEVKQCQSKEN